ncbi:MAG: hypothetical protein IT225_06360 [Flavobacteriales bacterium]|nr:hypothetical protein [Flavobacteriales bacterium]
MKQAFLIVLTSLFACAGAHSQVIALQSNGNSTFFYDVNNLSAIISAALDGDTIILPGGPITPSGSLTLTKRLVWVGAGYRPDTNVVTTPTVITAHPNNQIFIQQGASGSRFHGIRFERVVQVGGGAPSQVTDIGITRCEFASTLRLSAALGNSSANVQVRQCVLRQGIGIPQGMGAGALNAPQGFLAENCIIVGSIDFGASMTTGAVTNCILLSPDLASQTRNNGLTYSNCVFSNTANNLSINNPSYFEQCLFAQPGGALPNWGPTAFNLSGNLSSNLNSTNVFRNVPVWTGFDYNYDYRLTPTTSPALNMGGVDSGIYGGPSTWKEGAIPFNPHWISLNPLGNTTGGVISVNFSAAAQQD